MMYRDMNTNELWKEEEVREAFDQFKHEMEGWEERSFEEYLEDRLEKKILVPVEKVWIFVRKKKDGFGDWHVEEFTEKEKAIDLAKYVWDRMTYKEKKTDIVYVLESVNPDPEAEDHFDGDFVWKCNQKYEVDFHDFRNGATSAIDSIVETSDYTAEDYLYDLERNDSEWAEEAKHGEFILVPID